MALEEHFYKLKGTHELAKWMEGELREMGCGMLQEVETNMVSADDTRWRGECGVVRVYWENEDSRYPSLPVSSFRSSGSTPPLSASQMQR